MVNASRCYSRRGDCRRSFHPAEFSSSQAFRMWLLMVSCVISLYLVFVYCLFFGWFKGFVGQCFPQIEGSSLDLTPWVRRWTLRVVTIHPFGGSWHAVAKSTGGSRLRSRIGSGSRGRGSLRSIPASPVVVAGHFVVENDGGQFPREPSGTSRSLARPPLLCSRVRVSDFREYLGCGGSSRTSGFRLRTLE